MKRSSRRASRCALLACIERIEPRRLLAELVGSQLLIDTTDNDVRNNRVLVETVGDTLVVTTNRNVQRFPAADVASIVAHLGAGNDKIQIMSSVNLPTTLDGGAGNDTILAGPNADSILGGDGDDHIRPGRGNDSIEGGAGADEITYAERVNLVDARIQMHRIEQGTGFREWTTGSIRYDEVYDEVDTFLSTEVFAGGMDENWFILTHAFDYEAGGKPATTLRFNGGPNHNWFSLQGSWVNDNVGYTGVPVIANGGPNGDSLYAQYPQTTLIGGDGDDGIYVGADSLGWPTIQPGAGHDLLSIYQANRDIDFEMSADLEAASVQGDGSIRIVGNDLPNEISVLGRGTVHVEGRGGNDFLTNLDPGTIAPARSTLLGNEGNDTITGSNEGDWISGGEGDDSLVGGAGNDVLLPGAGNDTVDAGEGQDELSYADHAAAISGTLNAILIHGYDPTVVPPYRWWWSTGIVVTSGDERDSASGMETVTGGGGDDSLGLVSRTNDTVYTPLRSQVLRINGGKGNDLLYVYSLNDYYPGNIGELFADGGNGDDYFDGYAVYTAIGGEGDDFFDAVQDDDSTAPYINAGPGIDTLDFARLGTSYTMPEGLENLNFTATIGSFQIVGNDQANVIHASGSMGGSVDGRGGDDFIVLGYWAHPESRSTILGGTGNDSLSGTQGVDYINGGPGDDYLDGGGGADSIYGSTGTDTAVIDPNDAIVDSIEIFVGGRKTKRARFLNIEAPNVLM